MKLADDEIIVDFFAGGGGASQGIFQALGRHVDVAVNHDPEAIAMHTANHPTTRHFTESVWRVRPEDVTQGRKVGLFWASPDCTHFSRAKGGKPVKKEIRSLAWIVPRFCAAARPRVVILENVAEFEGWGPVVPLWRCSECDWKGTEGQATLAAGRRHRRACPNCDGRKLAQTTDLIPDPARKGTHFRRWWRKMESLEYVGEKRVVDFADLGAPTHRKRLLVVWRRDGQPIVWPDPSYAAPEKVERLALLSIKLTPYRMAAECIDWSIPIPSIFERKKPLADATNRRIAHGTMRYVLDNPRPFIVGNGGPVYSGEPRDALRPFGTILPKASSAIIVPHLAPITHTGPRRGSGADEPMPTITTAHRGEQAVLAASLIRYNGDEGRAANAHDLRDPLNTIPTENRFGIMAATMVQTGYGERDGQSPRALDLEKPMGALVSGNKTVTTSNHAGLVYAFMIKYYGQGVGQTLESPLGTATTKDRFGIVTATIAGEIWAIVDLCMRMLVPRELARGQSFPDTYILTGTKTSQVAKIGNSVPPIGAEAMVRANFA